MKVDDMSERSEVMELGILVWWEDESVLYGPVCSFLGESGFHIESHDDNNRHNHNHNHIDIHIHRHNHIQQPQTHLRHLVGLPLVLEVNLLNS